MSAASLASLSALLLLALAMCRKLTWPIRPAALNTMSAIAFSRGSRVAISPRSCLITNSLSILTCTGAPGLTCEAASRPARAPSYSASLLVVPDWRKGTRTVLSTAPVSASIISAPAPASRPPLPLAAPSASITNPSSGYGGDFREGVRSFAECSLCSCWGCCG